MGLDCAGELGWDKLGNIKGIEGRLGRIGGYLYGWCRSVRVEERRLGRLGK